MLLPPGLLSLESFRAAADAELDGSPRLLPPSSVHPALLARREEFAAWAFGRVQGEFVPPAEVTVAVSKAGHGVRPIAVWDLPSRLTYWALAERYRRRPRQMGGALRPRAASQLDAAVGRGDFPQAAGGGRGRGGRRH